MFCLRMQQGRLQELEADVRGFVAQYPGLPSWRCALALLYSELNRQAQARGLFEGLAAHDFADMPRKGYWLSSIAHLAQVCTSLGDARRAATLYELLQPYARHNVAVGAVACYGAVPTAWGSWPPRSTTGGRRHYVSKQPWQCIDAWRHLF